jgi:hypothetical protein
MRKRVGVGHPPGGLSAKPLLTLSATASPSAAWKPSQGCWSVGRDRESGARVRLSRRGLRLHALARGESIRFTLARCVSVRATLAATLWDPIVKIDLP